VSIHAYAHLADKYALLTSGASMGEKDYGPRLVARQRMTLDEVAQVRVAVPGTMTSAFLILKLILPRVETVTVPFDRIPEAVAAGEVEAGVLIHEAQLTYQEQKLELLLDFGAWWYDRHQLPLPLGGNAVRRDLGPELTTLVAGDLRRSIVYALEHREEALSHALQYAGELPREQADTFVGMYVNRRTVDYGEEGREAVRRLLREGYEQGVIPTRWSPSSWVDPAARRVTQGDHASSHRTARGRAGRHRPRHPAPAGERSVAAGGGAPQRGAAGPRSALLPGQTCLGGRCAGGAALPGRHPRRRLAVAAVSATTSAAARPSCSTAPWRRSPWPGDASSAWRPP